jgi:hypothetical protein
MGNGAPTTRRRLALGRGVGHHRVYFAEDRAGAACNISLVRHDGSSGDRDESSQKSSEDKATIPGSKQVFRFPDHDILALAWECHGCDNDEARALLRPVILNGRLVEPLPTLLESQAYALENVRRLPTATRSLFDTEQKYRIEHSRDLEKAIARCAGVGTGCAGVVTQEDFLVLPGHSTAAKPVALTSKGPVSAKNAH